MQYLTGAYYWCCKKQWLRLFKAKFGGGGEGGMMQHHVPSCRDCFLGETYFIFILKAGAHLVSPLTAGRCYTWQLSPFPEVMQALVLGNGESSPDSVRLFGALFFLFFPPFNFRSICLF